MKVLIFGAQWCAGCKVLKKNLEGQTFPGFEIEQVDADASPDLATKYGVRSLPAIVVPDLRIVQPNITTLSAFRQFLENLE